MPNLSPLERRINLALAAIEQRQDKDNILKSPDWPLMRSTILLSAAPFPDASLAVTIAIAQLGQMQRCTEKTMQDAIYKALEPFIEARVAVAGALVQIAREKSQ
jgi:hypothetical protein